jgi:PAS domain S-box-containing protein
MAMFDLEMRYVAVSERWLADYRIQCSPLGKSHYDVLPEMSEAWKAVHRQCLEGATESSEGEPFLRADGRFQWVKWSASPWRGSDGEIGGVILTTEDVTARREAEAEAAHYASVVMDSSDAIIAKTLDSIVTSWNAGATRLLGYEPEEMIGRSVTRIIPADRLGEEERILQRLRDGEVIAHFETQRVARDGSVLDVSLSISPMRNALGTIVGASKILRDIAERRKAEERLRASEERFRMLVEEAPDAILLYDVDKGRLVAVNKAAERLFGASRDKLFNYEPQRFYAPDQPDGRPASESFADRNSRALAGEVVTFDRRIRRPSGEDRVCRVTLVRLPSATRLLRSSLVDITEQKRIESETAAARLEAERADQAKSKFLAAASHDLRQPVQSLVLQMALAERQIADNPRALETLGKMRGSLEGLNNLLIAILDISRFDAGIEAEPEAVDMHALIRRLAIEYKPKADALGLTLRVAQRKLWATADPALLQRALRNLIDNALRYTQSGGVLLGLRRRGERVRIDVIDTGIGVPDVKREDIFEEFVQIHNPGRQLGQGLGLGLAIVARIAKIIDATIEVNSREKRGSRFSLTLPAAEAATSVRQAMADLPDPGGRVLIVEDNLIVRHALELLLTDWGYETVAAADGEHALDLAEKDGWRFGCIVTDQRLGAGLSGVETAKEMVRRSGRALPALVLTGDTARENIAAIRVSGFEVIHKPIAPEPLRRALAHAMGA